MVHRTDITVRSMGQASPGHDGVRRPALNGALLENNFSLNPTRKCCRLLATAVPPLHAIYRELLTL
jgi:hypothetical protein